MKKKTNLLKFFGETLVFMGIFGIQVMVIAMSKVSQGVYGYNEVITKTAQIDPKTYMLLLITSLLLFSLFLKVKGKK